MKVGDLNLKTIEKTLNDDFKKEIIIGYDKISKQDIHIDGDGWKDENGKKWKKLDGKIINVSIKEEIQEQKNIFGCRGCGKYMLLETNVKGMKLFMKTGKCSDCVIKEDTQRMINGTFKEYEKKQIRENMISWLKDLKKEVKIISENYYNQHFMNEYGKGNIQIEKWESDIDPTQLKELLWKMFDNTVSELGILPEELI